MTICKYMPRINRTSYYSNSELNTYLTLWEDVAVHEPSKCLKQVDRSLLCCVKGSEQGSSSERTRTAITAALCKKLKDLMGEFQNLRLRLQDEYRSVHNCSLPCHIKTRKEKSAPLQGV